MSKLFDTLEKIQAKETTSPPLPQEATPPPVRRSRRYLPFLLGLSIIVALVAAGQYLPFFKKNLSRQPDKALQSSPAMKPAPDSHISQAPSQAAPPANTSALAQVEYFNNHAMSLHDKGDAWAALYYFDKASKVAPQHAEPLINMAIILTQLDLGFPAARIFKKAYQLAPDNDHLRQAMELAITEQVLPSDFFETLPLPGMDGK